MQEGPLLAGRSLTLGILLQAHVERNRPDITVYRITRPSPFPAEYKLLPYYEFLNDMLRIRTGRSWEYKNDTMLIFNEAQLSFTYNTLWNDLIKNMPDSFDSRNFFVLRLSSYGYRKEEKAHRQRATSCKKAKKVEAGRRVQTAARLTR